MNIIKQEYKDIHNAIHSGLNSIVINNITFSIIISANGCRRLDYTPDRIMFMEQNKQKNSIFAQRAKSGEKITWGRRKGNWIFVNS